MNPFRTLLILLALTAWTPARPALAQSAPDLRGAWEATRYIMADGTIHAVRGHIFFEEREWTVLFFVLDGEGHPRRGSAEGGTYRLEGTTLTFTHEYNLSVGDAMPGLPDAPLQLTVRDPGTGPEEPSVVTLAGNRLSIDFPSGNRLRFIRLPNR